MWTPPGAGAPFRGRVCEFSKVEERRGTPSRQQRGEDAEVAIEKLAMVLCGPHPRHGMKQMVRMQFQVTMTGGRFCVVPWEGPDAGGIPAPFLCVPGLGSLACDRFSRRASERQRVWSSFYPLDVANPGVG